MSVPRRATIIGGTAMKHAPLAAGIAALALLGLAVPAPAYAAPPVEHFTDHVDVLFLAGEDPEFCPELSIDVRWVEDARGTFRFMQHGDGNYYGGVTFSVAGSYTNPENDLTFSYTSVGSDRDVHVTDNGDDTITIVGVSAGVSKYYDDSGSRLFVDAVRNAYSIVIDTGGTPDDPSDDEFVEFLWNDLRGRADTEGRDLCADLQEFLG
jgi:hypothetical protein